MYPLHDNDLDRLSREAAEHYDVEPGASGWERLEKRLDQELPNKKDRRRFLFWLFFIGMATGGGLTAVLLKYNRPDFSLAKHTVIVPVKKEATNNSNNTNNKTTATSKTATNDQNDNNNSPVEPGATPGNSTNSAAPVLAGKEPQNTTPPVTGPNNTVTQPEHKKPFLPNNTAGAGNPGLFKNTPRQKNDKRTVPGQVGKQNISSTTLPDQVNSNTPDITRTPLPGKKPDGHEVTTHQPVNDAADNPTSQTTDNTTNPTKVTSDINKSTTPIPTDSPATVSPVVQKDHQPAPKKNRTIKQPLELGLVAGPDKSMVEFRGSYKTGFNLGLQVSYRFSDRWSVNTGIIYTKKFYQADSQYYKGKWPWPNWKLDELKGYCSMLDIPVNVRYDVAFNEKRRFFVSTGLSTYLMDKENYTYYYYYGSNPNIIQTPALYNDNSQYIFSIVNLSAGFERSLGKHFSLQAEPYLKIPLKGMGQGKMLMDSYGVFFSLKYKPSFRSKKPATGKK